MQRLIHSACPRVAILVLYLAHLALSQIAAITLSYWLDTVDAEGMGQANSSAQQQQQQQNDGEGASHDPSQATTQGHRSRFASSGHNSPSRHRIHTRHNLIHNLHHHQQQQRDATKDTQSHSTKEGKAPRRKSLDMPDMSLSLTPSAASNTTNANNGSNSNANPNDSSISNITTSSTHSSDSASAPASAKANYPYPGTIVSDRNDEGVPLASTPLSPSGANANASLPFTASTSSATRWNSLKRGSKESSPGQPGMGLVGSKKSQAVTGSTSALHASGSQIQPSSNPSSSTSTPSHRFIHLPAVSTFNVGPPSNASTPAATPLPEGVSRQLRGVIGGAVSASASASTSPSPLTHPAPPFDLHSIASPTSPSTPDPTGIPASISSTLNAPFSLPMPAPLKEPTETILAPELPADVNNLIVPPILAPTPGGIIMSPTQSASGSASSTTANMSIVGEVTATGDNTATITSPTGEAVSLPMTATSSSSTTPAGFYSPLIPGSTPPLGNPPNTLPSAAPLAVLNPTLLSTDNPKIQEAVKNATVDLGAGPDGVPTLLTWKAEEEERTVAGRSEDRGKGAGPKGDVASGVSTPTSTGPQQVFVTGTFAKGWNTKIELRRKESDDHKQTSDFTALVKLPPGPHSLKFIVDKQWKTSKYLPSATDADGNLINYLQVHKIEQTQARPATIEESDDDVADEEDAEEESSADIWTSDIPSVLVAYGDATEAALDAQEAQDRALAERQANAAGSSSLPTPALPNYADSASAGSNGQGGAGSIPTVLPNPALLALNRKPLLQLQNIQPPSLPAQLEKGVLSSTMIVAKGSGDDNSLLPKPDHSVLNHLAASPIKGGLLSVGVTTRYRRKYVTTVYYKKPVIET